MSVLCVFWVVIARPPVASRGGREKGVGTEVAQPLLRRLEALGCRRCCRHRHHRRHPHLERPPVPAGACMLPASVGVDTDRRQGPSRPNPPLGLRRHLRPIWPRHACARPARRPGGVVMPHTRTACAALRTMQRCSFAVCMQHCWLRRITDFAQPSHTQQWPHGVKLWVLGAYMQTTHCPWSAASTQ